MNQADSRTENVLPQSQPSPDMGPARGVAHDHSRIAQEPGGKREDLPKNNWQTFVPVDEKNKTAQPIAYKVNKESRGFVSSLVIGKQGRHLESYLSHMRSGGFLHEVGS